MVQELLPLRKHCLLRVLRLTTSPNSTFYVDQDGKQHLQTPVAAASVPVSDCHAEPIPLVDAFPILENHILEPQDGGAVPVGGRDNVT